MTPPQTTRPTAPRRIGLLGGSFNPAHEGHREISLAGLSRLGLDAVWWLVTPGNPLKDKKDYAPFQERMARARKVSAHPDIVVSDFEQRQGLQYTVDALERLRLLHPDTAFVWLMGADSLGGFHRWKNWRRIATLVPMAVFNRPGHGDAALAGEAARDLAAFRIDAGKAATLADAEPPAWIYFSDADNPLSSTAIRNASSKTSKDNNTEPPKT